MANFVDSEELQINGRRAVLAGVVLPGEEFNEDHPLDELAELAKTAGIQAVSRVTQAMAVPTAGTYCGSGKAEEIADLVQHEGAQLVVFDNDLKPSQQQNLGEIVKARVMDRTELILMIFAEHARTHQAKLAVDFARIEYQLPRLRHLWSHLERQRGAVGKMGGAGELQIETDRRILRDRLQKIRRELAETEKRRDIEVSRRHDHFQVALVGYTNAGKSTLMRALTGADVYIADKLFATLDTRTRIWEFNDHRVLLSDTVGFIRNLPHSLVASFHATLSEAVHADLLLHVVDISHPAADQMIEAVEGVLEELGAKDKPTVLVLNKADRVRLPIETYEAQFKDRYKAVVGISALSGAGLTHLRDVVAGIVEERERIITVEASAGNGKLLAFLRENTKVLDQAYEDDSVKVRVLTHPRWLKRIEELNAAHAAPKPNA